MCISARLLKTRTLLKSIIDTFVVAYAPTEEAPEGQKAKYMAAINSTVASMPAREYVSVLTDVNARTGKRGEGGGVAGRKVLGGYGRNVPNVNGNLLLGFAEDKKLAPLTTIFDPEMWRVLHVPKRQPHQRTNNTFGLYPDKAGGPSTDRIVNVRRPPLETPESDDSLVNAKVRFPCRSTRSRRKGESTKDSKRLTPGG